MKYSRARVLRLFGREKHFEFDALFANTGLSPEKRLICSVSCLQAIGDSENLRKMLCLAISSRQDIDKLYEILLQGYLFCGYPRAIESFFCLETAIAASKFKYPAPALIPFVKAGEQFRRGIETAHQVHKAKFQKINNKISALSPDLGYLMVMEGYGHIICRAGVDLMTRELAIVSSLSALGTYRQLNSHIRGAINVGCDFKEVFEAIRTGSAWLDSDTINRALGIWSEITGHPIPNE